MKYFLVSIVSLFMFQSVQASELLECFGRKRGKQIELRFCVDFNTKKVVGCDKDKPAVAYYSYREVFTNGAQKSALPILRSQVKTSEDQMVMTMTDAKEKEDQKQVIRVTLNDHGRDKIEIFRKYDSNLIFRRANCRWN